MTLSRKHAAQISLSPEQRSILQQVRELLAEKLALQPRIQEMGVGPQHLVQGSPSDRDNVIHQQVITLLLRADPEHDVNSEFFRAYMPRQTYYSGGGVPGRRQPPRPYEEREADNIRAAIRRIDKALAQV